MVSTQQPDTKKSIAGNGFSGDQRMCNYIVFLMLLDITEGKKYVKKNIPFRITRNNPQRLKNGIFYGICSTIGYQEKYSREWIQW